MHLRINMNYLAITDHRKHKATHNRHITIRVIYHLKYLCAFVVCFLLFVTSATLALFAGLFFPIRMPEYRFIQLDVFTDRAFCGNPLAVFPEAEGISDDQMLKIAR